MDIKSHIAEQVPLLLKYLLRRIWNFVSEMFFGYGYKIEFFQSIVQLVVMPRFIPAGMDPLKHPGVGALGPDRNQMPLDRNVTFFFDYAKGLLLQLYIYLVGYK